MPSRRVTGQIVKRTQGQPSPVLGECAVRRVLRQGVVTATPGAVTVRLRVSGCREPAEKVLDSPEAVARFIKSIRAACRAAFPESDEGWRE